MSSASVKYFELCYELLAFPVEIFDDTGFLVYVNDAFTKKWGYNLNDLSGYSFNSDNELVKRDISRQIKKVLENGSAVQVKNFVDSMLIGGEKAAPFLNTTMYPLVFDNKTYVVLFHEDQTEVLLAEEEVRKARDASKEADRLKSTFLDVLSHELRTPLNIILGYSSIIKDNLKDKISDEDKIYLDNLYSGSERLFKSITQMLEFAQIEAGSYKMNIETVNLVNVFRNCVSTFKDKATTKKLDFSVRYEVENIFVDADLQCVESVINNLLDNAIKFTKQGYIDVEVETLQERELAICKLKDTGIGISTEYLDHLYRPFSQEELDVGRNFEGNGLGLAISKRYLEKMGGSLIVDSIKGVGSTFTFTLPLARRTKTENTAEIVKSNNGVAKILMLDDSGDSYPLIKAYLKDKYDISILQSQEFNSGYLSDKNFSAIIFDVTVNYWNKSLDLVKKVRTSIDGNIPILILSSEFLQERIQQFRTAGANEFLVKPFGKADIVNSIQKITKQ